MSINIEVEGGKSVRLKTAGKYCDRDIVVTAKGGASGENKLAKVADKTVTEITAEDLEGATMIGARLFARCGNLQGVEIPNGVTNIDNYAFQYCYALKKISIPNSVTRIGDYSFASCAFENFISGNGLSEICNNTFSSCGLLKNVTLGSSLAKIGNLAFSGCVWLKSVTIKATTPPSIQSTTFQNVPTDCPFYVPPASVEAYKAATNWSARADYIFPILDGAQKGDLIWSATATGGKISWDSSIFEFNKVYFVENSAFNVYSEYGEPYPRIGTIFTAIDGKEYEIFDVQYGEVGLKTTDGSEVTENLVVNFYSAQE